MFCLPNASWTTNVTFVDFNVSAALLFLFSKKYYYCAQNAAILAKVSKEISIGIGNT